MAKTKKPAKAQPIVDVAQPGKTAPSDNSRSVIVTHRSRIEDPMMVATAGTTAVEEITAAKPVEKVVPKVVTPPALAPSKAPLVSEIVAKHKKAEAEAALHQKEAAPVDSEPKEKESKPETPVDPLVNDEVKQAEHDVAVEKLIESKQYFLPINAVEKRRTKRVVLFGVVLSLFLILAWLDVALDAGLVHIPGIEPPTHFF